MAAPDAVQQPVAMMRKAELKETLQHEKTRRIVTEATVSRLRHTAKLGSAARRAILKEERASVKSQEEGSGEA
eukprot:3718345-Prymnesium_polylepis.1